MPRQEFTFDPPERFVVGTVGEPGERTFFLQARAGNRLTSVVCEKEQVAVLAERMDALLDEVLRRSAGSAAVPAIAPSTDTDDGPLEVPIVEEFRVGTLTLAWDADEERVVIEAFAGVDAGEDDSPAEDGTESDNPAGTPVPADDIEGDESDPVEALGVSPDTDVLTVRLTGAAARAFVRRTLAVVQAGRPPCPLCQQPLDPQGHVCPRQNGYRRRA